MLLPPLTRSLIRLCSRFGDYRKDDPDSFQLRPQLSYYPQFLFNFRRSQFIQVRSPLLPAKAVLMQPPTPTRTRTADLAYLLPRASGFWQLARRDRVCAHHAEPRAGGGGHADAAAHALFVLVCGAARAGAAGRHKHRA